MVFHAVNIAQPLTVKTRIVKVKRRYFIAQLLTKNNFGDDTSTALL
jgi:hypothetical protein